MIYKSSFSVNSLFVDNKSTVLFCNNCIIIKKPTYKEILIDHNALGGVFRNNEVFYYTQNVVFNNFKKLCDKDTLDYVLILKDSFILVKETELIVYEDFRSPPTVHPVNSRGVCIGGLRKDEIYLGFENGSICQLKDYKLIEIIKMDDNITSFDVLNEKICISFFHYKLCVCDKSGNNFLYTEIPFTIKTTRFWMDHIVTLDEENNFSLFDTNLQLLYTENYEDRLSSFEIIEDVLYLIMKDNTVISTENITEYL